MTAFDIIKTARAINASLGPEPIIKATSVADYQKIARKLFKDGESNVGKIINEASKTTSPRTWFKRQAALKWTVRRVLTKGLAKQDQLQRQMKLMPDDNSLRQKWMLLVKGLDLYSSLFLQIPVDCPIPKERRKKRHSKKHDLAGLPSDWRERLLSRMHKYYLPFLVAAVTGCRPAELTKGVLLVVKDGKLVASIVGAKVTPLNGQPWRELGWILPKEGMIGQLAEDVIKSGNNLVVKIDNPKNFSSAVRDAAKREWPHRLKTVTPYCLRHVFSADTKASSLSRQSTAAALGQAVDTTPQCYGTARQAGSVSVCPDQVKAAREVRRRYTKEIPLQLVKQGKLP